MDVISVPFHEEILRLPALNKWPTWRRPFKIQVSIKGKRATATISGLQLGKFPFIQKVQSIHTPSLVRCLYLAWQAAAKTTTMGAMKSFNHCPKPFNPGCPSRFNIALTRIFFYLCGSHDELAGNINTLVDDSLAAPQAVTSSTWCCCVYYDNIKLILFLITPATPDTQRTKGYHQKITLFLGNKSFIWLSGLSLFCLHGFPSLLLFLISTRHWSLLVMSTHLRRYKELICAGHKSP